MAAEEGNARKGRERGISPLFCPLFPAGLRNAAAAGRQDSPIA